MKLYKVLGKNGISCNGGSGQWYLPKDNQPGEWMPEITDIIPCQRGYHLCRGDDLIHWLNEEIYEAEGKGKSIRDTNKDVFEQARLIRKLDSWNEKTERLFAADCAEHVLHLFESKYPNDDRPRRAIKATRDYANGLIDAAAWAAAGAAAWAAAGAAAWAAAWAAAGAAAWDAAGAAAWDAARAAARDAVWAAAWDAAGAAETKWQTKRLFGYLKEGEECAKTV